MLCLPLAIFTFIFPMQVLVTATVACSGIALAEQYDGRLVSKSICSRQFVTAKIAEAQVCSLNG